jgi:hypothetical protein
MKLTAVAAASCLLALLFLGGLAAAQQPFDASVYTSMGGPQDSIPVGTKITTQNWQQYERFMSLGMRSQLSQKVLLEDPGRGGIGSGTHGQDRTAAQVLRGYRKVP